VKKREFNVSLFILIPVIFSGIVLLALIISYRITSHYLEHGIDPVSSLVWLGIFTIVITFACSFLILRLILRPIFRFVREAEKFKVLSKGSNETSGAEEKTEEIARLHQVLDQVTTILTNVEAREHFPDIISQSRSMRGILGQVMKVSPTDTTVLISGESGTGKELVATAIYEQSLRRDRPFIKLNCVAIPEGLLESELFGHEKGAFTGAGAQKKGKFELADGGTIFLDEIGDMPLATQAKLLRVLQEREFERVGGTKPIRVDVRFIAATNKNLNEMVKTGTFRDDLYFRLNVFSLHLPPLRERIEDIPHLIECFLDKTGKMAAVSSGAMQILLGYSWPGNIRELQNVIERAAVIADDLIEPAHLPQEIRGGNVTSTGRVDDGKSIDERLGELEKGIIVEAMTRAGGVQVRAAQLLGINQRSLWHRIKKFGIDASSLKNRQDL
jgi:transcriptional regulator with PAS, ATPase and Fis domain